MYNDHLASYEWLNEALQAVQMLIEQSVDEEVQRFIHIGQLVEMLDNGFRQVATLDAVSSLNADIAHWAKQLSTTMSLLDATVWQLAIQQSQQLVQLCQLAADDGAMMTMQEIQQTLQHLTHRLTDVFAA